jgi:hypothetical protein
VAQSVATVGFPRSDVHRYVSQRHRMNSCVEGLQRGARPGTLDRCLLQMRALDALRTRVRVRRSMKSRGCALSNNARRFRQPLRVDRDLARLVMRLLVGVQLNRKQDLLEPTRHRNQFQFVETTLCHAIAANRDETFRLAKCKEGGGDIE